LITKKILTYSRNTKRLIILFVDLLLLPFALWLSFSLRLGVFYVPEGEIIYLFLAVPLIAVPIFVRFGLYRAIIRYIGFLAMWTVVQAVSLYTLFWGVLVLLTGTGLSGVPRSVLLINWLVAVLLIGGSRAIARWWLSGSISSTSKNRRKKRVIIYGAGGGGIQIAKALSGSPDFHLVAFIDDNRALQKNYIQGLRVYSFSDISSVIENYKVNEVLLAMPSVSRSRRREIIVLLEPYPVRVMILPGLDALASGQVKVEDVREVGVRDLLGRDPVEPDLNLLNANVKHKAVLVTGAGGSIGSELCRQILKINPAALILYEQSESALYAIEKELNELVQRLYPEPESSVINITPILASVTNQSRLEIVCTAFGVQTIYHAAAYKHVPMVEKNPLEAVSNNVLGTYRATQAAINTGVETFVLISTDKAVRPTNTMGASKRFAEMILQGVSRHRELNTRFTMVRFGNVLDSSGSVIPLFREQIKNGGPVTVTDPKIIRYFMTIPEAVGLILQAATMGKGGEIYVLEMGRPVNIRHLAEQMIQLAGLKPYDDIPIVFTGLRPGEKLFEELFHESEGLIGTSNPKLLLAGFRSVEWEWLPGELGALEAAAKSLDIEALPARLKSIVPEFNPGKDLSSPPASRDKSGSIRLVK